MWLFGQYITSTSNYMTIYNINIQMIKLFITRRPRVIMSSNVDKDPTQRGDYGRVDDG